jgi:hypothetical protein
VSGVQLVDQSLGLLQIECIKALSEPAVDWSEKLASIIKLALVALEPQGEPRRVTALDALIAI